MTNNISAEGARIHWFPGHMMKTLRSIEKSMPLVDAVVQLLDARIPQSSQNPDLQKLYRSKPRLYVMNKADLANPNTTTLWLNHFRAQNAGCVATNSKQKGAAAKVRTAMEQELDALFQRRSDKGMSGAKIRLMIVGIPNVGKSTFINNWVGSAKTKAADKPGVTRGKQWVSAGQYELLDMPGVLWRKIENPVTAVNLALIGSIPDTLLDVETIAAGLLEELRPDYSELLESRFKLRAEDLVGDGWALLENTGRRRGMLISGGMVDTERAATMVLDEFRAGKLGRISLEKPQRSPVAGEETDDA